MTEKEKKPGVPENGMNGNANGAGAERDESAEANLEKQVDELNEQTARIEKKTEQIQEESAKLQALADRVMDENDRLNDKILRMAADFENYKKRSESEKARARLEGTLEMAAEVFSVLDSLELALRHASAESADIESIAEGVRLTYERSISQLGNFGINQITAKPGEKFDPSRHQAIENRPSDEIKKGCVAEEIAKGYRAGDTLVRPVAVAVSSGPPEKTEE